MCVYIYNLIFCYVFKNLHTFSNQDMAFPRACEEIDNYISQPNKTMMCVMVQIKSTKAEAIAQKTGD